MLFYPVLLLGSIIFLDACLSGDNAVVIAMAANGLEKSLRDAAIFGGMILAALLRIVLAVFAVSLLQYPWIGFFGGVALLWVAYSLFRDMSARKDNEAPRIKKVATLSKAILMIIIADVSMSLDNVLAVAALAREHVIIMGIGILASIVMLAFAARWIAAIMEKRPWLNWIGIALIVYVAIDLIAGTFNFHLLLLKGI